VASSKYFDFPLLVIFPPIPHIYLSPKLICAIILTSQYRIVIPDIMYYSFPRRDEVTGEWRILHNEELNDLYSSPNIVRVIKSRRMRWVGQVARMGEGRGCIGSWWGNRREGDHWGDLGVDGWIILG